MHGAAVLILLLWRQAAASVQVADLRVPKHAAAGSEVLLRCEFDIENDKLYSVKWYKDGREFYRYVPERRPSIATFRIPGIRVDTTRSSRNMVTLVNLTRESKGTYTCEVSGEAPSFVTASKNSKLKIFILPEAAPILTGLNDLYTVGDLMVVNCTSPASYPEAELKWYINGKPVATSNLMPPWLRPINQDQTETILQLNTVVRDYYFINNQMEVKCAAKVSDLYYEETVRHIYNSIIPRDFTERDPIRKQITNKLNEAITDQLTGFSSQSTKSDDQSKDHAVITTNSIKVTLLTLLIQIVMLQILW